LNERLSDIDWCNNLIDLLQDSTEHDTREKALESIKTLLHVCSYKFDLNAIVKILKDLIKEYDQLAVADADDEYFRNLSNLALHIKDHLTHVKKKILYQEEL
jgi:hypothetical protein